MVWLAAMFLPDQIRAQLPDGWIVSREDSLHLQALVVDPPPMPDTLSLEKKLQLFVAHLHAQSFLEASADRVEMDSTTGVQRVFLHVGPPFYWNELDQGNLENEEFQVLLVNGGEVANRPVLLNSWRSAQKRLLEWAANQGYPFAELQLENLSFDDAQVSGRWRFNKNKLVRIGSIEVEGNAAISPTFLENYLGLRPGSRYSEERIRLVRKRIEELPFLGENRDLVVTFQKDEAIVNLFLEKKPSSRFDFLIGLQPRDEAFALIQARQVIFTGTLNADLANAFGYGERLRASFEQLRPETQDLELGFNLPYAFGLRFGTDLNLQLYKRDSAWLDVIYDLGIQYLFDGSNYLKVYWNRSATNLLTINEAVLRSTRKLPENLDVTNETFGLEYQMRRLDYQLNPRKGWEIWLKGGAGERRIRKNSLITGITDTLDAFDFGSLYDSLTLESFQFRARVATAVYLPLFRRSTLKFSMSGGYLFSREGLFQNELFRIGGNKLLRGFDEETIFANLFAVFTTEYRLLIGRNDYFFIFADLSYAEKNTLNQYRVDHPIGFGSGLVFETSVGLFGANIAFGRQLNNPIDFSAPKIHFGYVNLF